MSSFAELIIVMARTILNAVLLLAVSTTVSAASGDRVAWWTPRLIICDWSGCHEAPDPYWDGPYRVLHPCREWRQCYWHQRWS
jgi:hypothetical protein